MIGSLLRRLAGERATQDHPLSDLVGPDGGPSIAPDQVAQALLARLIEQPTLHHEQTTVAAIHALAQISGTMSWLPGGDSTALNTDTPMHRLRCHAEAVSLPCPTAATPTPDWRGWAWRGSGCAVSHAAVTGAPSRLWITPTAMQWDWDHHTLLAESLRSPYALLSARVDGQKFTATQQADAARRRVQVHRARVLISAEQTPSVQWTLCWPAVRTDSGIEARHAERILIGKLDPGWSWSVDGHTITGTGSSRLRCSFELR